MENVVLFLEVYIMQASMRKDEGGAPVWVHHHGNQQQTRIP